MGLCALWHLFVEHNSKERINFFFFIIVFLFFPQMKSYGVIECKLMACITGYIAPLVENGTKAKVHDQKQWCYTAISVCFGYILDL